MCTGVVKVVGRLVSLNDIVACIWKREKFLNDVKAIFKIADDLVL